MLMQVGGELFGNMLITCVLLQAEGAPIPLLLSSVIGLTLSCMHVNGSHTVDQGVASHILANVFVEVMQGWGANNEFWVQRLHAVIRRW